MQSRVQKWGNSLALRIPKTFATEIGLTDDTPVDISLVDGKLVIAPVPLPTYALADLLAGITDDNIHAEQATGPAEGSEVW